MKLDTKPGATPVASRTERLRRFVLFSSLGVLCAAVGSPGVFAQGCAMCYTTAAAQNPQAARALDLAIMVLLLPTLLLFIGVLVFAIRRSNAQAETSAPLEPRQPAAAHAHPRTVLRLSLTSHTR